MGTPSPRYSGSLTINAPIWPADYGTFTFPYRNLITRSVQTLQIVCFPNLCSPVITCTLCRAICGVIKQNQSEVGHIQFSVSYWIVTSICKATFCSSKDISN